MSAPIAPNLGMGAESGVIPFYCGITTLGRGVPRFSSGGVPGGPCGPGYGPGWRGWRTPPVPGRAAGRLRCCWRCCRRGRWALLKPADATAGAALLGAATAVGGNLLTDIVKAGIARLGGNTGDCGDGEPSRQGLETELKRRIQQILEDGGQEAEELRAEIARLLDQVGAVGAAIQAGDRDLQEQLARGVAGLGRKFAEFAFTLAAVEDRLRVLRDGQDAQGAQLGLVVGSTSATTPPPRRRPRSPSRPPARPAPRDNAAPQQTNRPGPIPAS